MIRSIANSFLHIILALLITAMPGTLFADNSLVMAAYEKAINRVNLNNVDQLYKLIEDPKIITEVKIKAVKRVGELYRNDPENGNAKAAEMVAILENSISKYKDDTSPFRKERIRAQACLELSAFDASPEGGKAVAVVSESFQNDKDIEVVNACGKSLGYFIKNKEKAYATLWQKLEPLLKKETIQKKDNGIVITIANAIYRLKAVEGFIPMLYVLDSGYPLEVKMEAERTLDFLELEMSNKKKKG